MEVTIVLSPREKRTVIQISATYLWMDGELYKIRPDLMIQKCLREDEVPQILKACHGEPCGGHFTNKIITYKVLILGYYWSSLFKDTK